VTLRTGAHRVVGNAHVFEHLQRPRLHGRRFRQERRTVGFIDDPAGSSMPDQFCRQHQSSWTTANYKNREIRMSVIKHGNLQNNSCEAVTSTRNEARKKM
jgi:hypothetical protein